MYNNNINNQSKKKENKSNNDNKNERNKIIEKKSKNIKDAQSLNNSFSKEFTNISENIYEEDDDNNLLANSYSYSQINKYKEDFLKEPLSIILESYLYDKNSQKRKEKFLNIKELSQINNKQLSNKLIKNKKTEEYLEIRKNSNNENNYNNIFKAFLEESNLKQFYQTILNVKYSLNSINLNSNVSAMLTLEHLFEEIILKNQIINQNINNDDLDNKYNKLKPIIYKYRKIKGDGNCYYRAVMFRYIEKIILSENIALLKKISLDMEKCFNSQEIKSRYKIKMDIKFNPELHLKIMALIIYLMEKREINEAHKLFVKCILSCPKFDYGLILYFRYIIYLYIKDNENKLFSEFFPIKVGNLLPLIYENEKGEFEFSKFYSNYLLKMFMEAEKIIIYLTPFILETNLDVIIFEDNEEQLVKRLSYKKINVNSSKKKDNAITLLNIKDHYELVYTYEEYNKYSKLFEVYLFLEPNNNIDLSKDNDFFLLETNRNKINNNNGRNYDNSINSKLRNIDNNTKNIIINNNDNYNNNLEYNKRINNNLINKDNNEKMSNNSDTIKNKVIKNKVEMEIKSIAETPFGHPEYKSDDNYLNNIDIIFSKKNTNNYCTICKHKIMGLIQGKYEICNNCLQNEILSQLKKEYSDYLSKGIFNNKFSIKQIKIGKYTFYIKDIIEVLKININIKDEKELKDYLKRFVCIKCFKILDKNKIIVNLPCKCCICDKDELENYLLIQNILSDNFTCICGYKYESKDLYNLSIECNKVGSISLILFLINIFNKSILTRGCSGCGKIGKFEKIKYEPEDKSTFCFENYLKLRDANVNLDHNMCKDCKRRYKNQKFICYYCNKIHLCIPE